MAAANTDKLKKLSRKWVGQIGAGGVADESVTTIPLASSANLATDTAVVATIDRVDSSGTKTPTLEETVIGVVSGNNLVNCVRGSEGTAQAHNAGAVVEILVTAKGWNDLVDWGLIAHNQDGTHKSGSVLTLPQINDTSSDHQYIFSVCELAADRTVALPLLSANDEFTFNAAAQTLTNKTLTAPVISAPQFTTQAYFDAEVDNGNSGTADTIDWTTGNKQKTTVTGGVTYTFTAPSGPCNLILKVVNGGSQTITWPNTVMWPGGNKPTLTTSGTDIVAMYWDGQNYYAQASLAFAVPA